MHLTYSVSSVLFLSLPAHSFSLSLSPCPRSLSLSPSPHSSALSPSPCSLSLSPEDLSFRWMLDEFPIFIPLGKRRFVSQRTGNLYISKVESSDSGNYSCFVSSASIAKSVFSKFIPLVPLAERE